MKPNFQKGKLALNRKTSATSNNNKERETPPQQKQDKLLELKAKIEKEREIMRMSGKRFNKGNNNSTKEIQTNNNLQKTEKSENGRFLKKENKVTEVSVGQQLTIKVQEYKPPTRSTVDLNSLVTETQELSMSNSRLFEKQLAQQKDRNRQVANFLKNIGLEAFTEGLINLGYDELDVLVEVSNEQLNFLMMRAQQQRILTAALKEYRDKNGLKQIKTRNSQLEMTLSSFKGKTQNKAVKQEQNNAIPEVRPKSAFTVASTTPTNNSGLFSNSIVKPNPSFFIGIGGQQWSMDSLIRRACSSCFKVFPGGQLIQQNSSYYCKPCKQKEEDPLGISMNSSMIRDYKL